MEKRVTLQDIAKKLGVHLSTAARAMRDDPRLKVETRQKAQAIAQELGYEPDPNARGMAIYRRAIRPVTEHGTLAMLSFIPTPAHELVEGACLRAKELGYHVDVIPCGSSALSGRPLARILKARGISGLIVLGVPASLNIPKRLRLDWSHFSAVGIGASLKWPPIHRVGDNTFRNTKLVMRKLRSLGYRRIGLFVERKMATVQADGGWQGGYFAEMEHLDECPKPLYREPEVYEEKAIRNWIHRERLDAVVADHDYSAKRVIALCGRAVPKELGVACLSHGSSSVSGVNQHFNLIGAMAVDFVTHLMHTHQRGIPEFPQRHLLEGSWFPGETTRRITKSTPVPNRSDFNPDSPTNK